MRVRCGYAADGKDGSTSMMNIELLIARMSIADTSLPDALGLTHISSIAAVRNWKLKDRSQGCRSRSLLLYFQGRCIKRVLVPGPLNGAQRAGGITILEVRPG